MEPTRIRYPSLLSGIVSAEEAATIVQDGMTVGMRDFRADNRDGLMAQAGLLNVRLPFQVDSTLRQKINDGEVSYVDHHISETAEQLRAGALPPIDVALIAACQRWPRGQIKVAAHSAAPRLQNHRRAIQCP